MFHVKQIMKKSENKTGYQILAGAGFIQTLVFFSELGMRYENIGSYTGAFLGIMLGILGIAGIHRETLSRTGQILFSIAKPIGLVIGGILLVTFGFMIFAIPKTQPAEDATVIILGCGVNSDGSPSAIMQERVNAGLKYLESHPDVPVIVSGGQLGGAPISEAESMKQCLIEQGIEENRIYIEDQSRTTAENLRFSTMVIKENRLSQNVAVVTSEFHLARACLYAKRNGLNPAPVKAVTPWYALPSYALREVYAVFDAFVIHRR